MQSARKHSLRKIDVNENLAEIISLITIVDTDALNESIDKITDKAHLTQLIEIAALKDDIEQTVYCDKTGQPIDYWSDNTLTKLISCVGHIKAKEIINERVYSGFEEYQRTRATEIIESIPNVFLFNMDILVAASIFYVIYPTPNDLNKKNFIVYYNRIKDSNVGQFDLIRYIRKLRLLLV